MVGSEAATGPSREESGQLTAAQDRGQPRSVDSRPSRPGPRLAHAGRQPTAPLRPGPKYVPEYIPRLGVCLVCHREVRSVLRPGSALGHQRRNRRGPRGATNLRVAQLPHGGSELTSPRLSRLSAWANAERKFTSKRWVFLSPLLGCAPAVDNHSGGLDRTRTGTLVPQSGTDRNVTPHAHSVAIILWSARRSPGAATAANRPRGSWPPARAARRDARTNPQSVASRVDYPAPHRGPSRPRSVAPAHEAPRTTPPREPRGPGRVRGRPVVHHTPASRSPSPSSWAASRERGQLKADLALISGRAVSSGGPTRNSVVRNWVAGSPPRLARAQEAQRRPPDRTAIRAGPR